MNTGSPATALSASPTALTAGTRLLMLLLRRVGLGRRLLAEAGGLLQVAHALGRLPADAGPALDLVLGAPEGGTSLVEVLAGVLGLALARLGELTLELEDRVLALDGRFLLGGAGGAVLLDHVVNPSLWLGVLESVSEETQPATPLAE